MTADILAGVLGVMGLGLLLIGWLLRDALAATTAARAGQTATEQSMLSIESARDAALASATQAQAERDEARTYAATLEKSLASARQELTKYVQAKLSTGSDADVAAELDRLLGQPVPAVHPATPTASASDGAPAAGAVPHP